MKKSNERKSSMQQCLTIPLLFTGVSGCLVENPNCTYAHKFGFSYACRHADHVNFRVQNCAVMTAEEGNERYEMLRAKRRDAFIQGLDEASREYFCQETDFFGDSPAVSEPNHRSAA